MATNNVLVNNLCSWPLYFWRKTGQGDIEIPANAKNYPLLSYEEVLAQIQTNNVMFTGIDGMGNHARIQIVDDEQRKQLFGLGDAQVEQPDMLTPDSVKDLLAIKSREKFIERLKEMTKTNAEKKMLVELAENAGSANVASWKVDALREIAETATL